MILWLTDIFPSLSERLQFLSAGDSRVFLTARIAMATITSFLLAIILGPFAIRWLKARFTEKVKSASARLDEMQKGKEATPTMGGLFIIGAVVLAGLLWGDLSNSFVQYGLILCVGLTIVGGVDDWIKLRTQQRGLTARQKFGAQAVVAAIVAAGIAHQLGNSTGGAELILPVGRWVIPLGIFFIPWAILAMLGGSNGVNLTDGLDGLAAGCTIFVGATMAALTYAAGHSGIATYLSIPSVPGSGETAVLLGALIGAMLGFLWFNAHPAQVFMGDTGALPVGGLLAFSAIVCRQEVLFVVCSSVFVAETVSVIAQMGSARMLGVKPLLCAPLHNHFLFRGDHETKIVTRCWIVSALSCIAAFALLKVN
ncbi:phospho-N-acetylmuramoyl-pentapeptide-transferase [Stratiformator vulcanicus]|uniref:Phospho-N-acetylmuramoyl-pentapeptide-transferase n=1 Tax=Stratiformator vulcanicus TaxID=2527980 RepID=A0A517R2T6_9PLAN|nr:phospho-N-acetylmuramoyl-pentapeptide-transferase [Stratiformator vulcanicus]QDT38189.1 Phospho-N-acetylmuramoyl-pentapeptide-transferase MraY [Stratiformator vulcanicus]